MRHIETATSEEIWSELHRLERLEPLEYVYDQQDIQEAYSQGREVGHSEGWAMARAEPRTPRLSWAFLWFSVDVILAGLLILKW